jgi:branched-chain amino acid aminotransferase
VRRSHRSSRSTTGQIGTGEVGPITAQLKELYFDVVRGRMPKYHHWLTPIY